MDTSSQALAGAGSSAACRRAAVRGVRRCCGASTSSSTQQLVKWTCGLVIFGLFITAMFGRCDAGTEGAGAVASGGSGSGRTHTAAAGSCLPVCLSASPLETRYAWRCALTCAPPHTHALAFFPSWPCPARPPATRSSMIAVIQGVIGIVVSLETYNSVNRGER